MLGRSRKQTSAQAASRRFPRARNPIVHAVEARGGVLVSAGGQSVRVGQAAAAAAAEAEKGDVREPASAAIPRLNLTGVCTSTS